MSILSDLFIYDPDSKTGLRWAVDIYSGKSHKKLEVAAGDVAGCVVDDGYAVVNFNGKRKQCHEIVWELHYGPVPEGLEIDHKDGQRSNNAVENLRLVSRELNARNKKPSGAGPVAGVWLYSCIRKGKTYRYWRVSLTDPESGLTRQKDYSLQKMSSEAALAFALEYRERKIMEFNNMGAGYTERHLGVKYD